MNNKNKEKKIYKIGLNLLFINPKLLGGSVIYALRLVKEISNLDKSNKYILYINKSCKELNFEVGSNFEIRILNFNYISAYYRYFWEQLILPFYIWRDKIDLLHSLGYVSPILSNVKKVVSILDINYKGHANNMNPIKRILLGFMVRMSAKFSNKIITISKFSKLEISKYTKIDESKIVPILLSGSSDIYDEHVQKKFKINEKYNIDSKYLIAFSSPSPHKNIERLIDAVKKIFLIKSNFKLVLVGHQNKSKILLKKIQEYKLEDKVIFTGFIPDNDVKPLISNSSIFVFPSLYEGFGIPLLDAQACQVPVVSSNAGSLPEIGGKYIAYFDPQNTKEMIETILRILDNKELSNEMVKKGLENRQKFSWQSTAQQTLNVYKDFLSN